AARSSRAQSPESSESDRAIKSGTKHYRGAVSARSARYFIAKTISRRLSKRLEDSIAPVERNGGRQCSATVASFIRRGWRRSAHWLREHRKSVARSGECTRTRNGPSAGARRAARSANATVAHGKF